jgi:predicted nucleic acid-binding protein/DNA-binding HxlR family transcriptional regulator
LLNRANRTSYERILWFKLGKDKSIVKDGYKALIIASLFDGEATLNEISERLVSEFNLPWLPTYILREHLKELLESGEVILKNGKYALAEKEKIELEKVINKRKELLEILNKNVIDGIKKYYKLDNTIQNEIINIVKDIIATFFTQASRLFVGYLMEEKKLVFDVPRLKEIIEEKTSKLKDPELSKAAERGIKEGFLNADPFTYEILFEIFQIYVYFEVLNIDTECKIPFNVKNTYLDTNVLMDLLLPTRDRHLLAKETIKISQELGIVNKYTKRTAEELITLIENYKKVSSLSEETLKKISQRDKGGLIEAFLNEKTKNPSLTFEGYCIWLEKAYKKILKEEFNIEIDDVEYEETKKHMEELKPLVNKAALINLDYKPEDSIDHDAFNLQNIIEHQKNKDMTLFVTDDYSLFYVSKFLIDRGEISKPLSVTLEVWLQALVFIRPLARIWKTSLEAFKEFLTQSLSTRLRPISMERLLPIAYPWLKDEYLTPEDLEDIASTKFIEEYIIRPQEKKRVPIVSFEEIVPKLIDEKLKQKIEKLEEEIKQVKEEKQQLEEKYLKLVKTPIKIKPLFFLGVVTFLIFISFAILSGFRILTIPDTVYYCLMILIVTLLGSSIFGEKIFYIIYRLKSKKLS